MVKKKLEWEHEIKVFFLEDEEKYRKYIKRCMHNKWLFPIGFGHKMFINNKRAIVTEILRGYLVDV